jgi:hypothetical protein
MSFSSNYASRIKNGFRYLNGLISCSTLTNTRAVKRKISATKVNIEVGAPSTMEHLPSEVKRELKQVGWSKGLELAKLARRRNGQDFDCATWLHKAREMPF